MPPLAASTSMTYEWRHYGGIGRKGLIIKTQICCIFSIWGCLTYYEACFCINRYFCRDAIKEDTEINTMTIVEAVLKECKKTDIIYKNQALLTLGEMLSSLEIDKFEELYGIIQEIIVAKSDNKEEDGLSAEELSKNRESNIKLIETAYLTLGRAWPEHSKSTQEKHREFFVEQTVQCLPIVTRSVQVSVMSALYAYVDKLILLKEDNLTDNEKESLRKIINDVLKAVQYAVSISKHTRLRTEALNIVFCLGMRLKEKERKQQLEIVCKTFDEILPNIAGDNQPEIKSRVNDIKKILTIV